MPSREQGTPVKIRDGPAAVSYRDFKFDLNPTSLEVPLLRVQSEKAWGSGVASQKTYHLQTISCPPVSGASVASFSDLARFLWRPQVS